VGQEKLPVPMPANSSLFPLLITVPSGSAAGTAASSVFEPSHYEGDGLAAAPWRRFLPAGKKEVKSLLKKSAAFAAWAARRRYDALIFPLAAFTSAGTARKLKELRKFAGEYGITLEAGGRELSLFVPRNLFLFHKDYFRMEEGRRTKEHHFCPTNPSTTRVIRKMGGKLFRAAKDVTVFHLWPDKGAERAWCSCPSCRAFTPAEQNRIGVNAAADTLADLNSGASITFYENRDERGNISLRKNLFGMDKLPEERVSSNL